MFGAGTAEVAQAAGRSAVELVLMMCNYTSRITGGATHKHTAKITNMPNNKPIVNPPSKAGQLAGARGESEKRGG